MILHIWFILSISALDFIILNSHNIGEASIKFLERGYLKEGESPEKRIRDIVENDKNVNLSNVKITMQIKSTELQIDEKIDGKIDVD